jgi:hypothetical protein
VAETYKVLGQSNPAATTLTDLYTVPGATSVVSSSIVVCNRGSGTIKFRISVAVAGAADDNKQYLFYDTPLQKNSSMTVVLGITLAATDVVRVRTDVATASFNIFGAEVTP